MDNKQVKMEWCAFGFLTDSVGRVMRDTGYYLEIMYSEGQFYPWELWDPKYVRRFGTPEEAIAHVCLHSGDPVSFVVEGFFMNYPSVKEVDEKRIAVLMENMEKARLDQKEEAK
jgi:hypothetical protein